MRRNSILKLAAGTAVVVAAGLGTLIPSWAGTASAGRQAGAGQQASAGETYGTGMHDGGMAMAGTGDDDAALIQKLAEARLATAKYSTDLAAAKADGYKIITKMMPN